MAKKRNAASRRADASRLRVRPDLTVVAQNAVVDATFGAPVGRTAHRPEAPQGSGRLLEQTPELVRRSVEAMTRLVTGHGALDVLALTRQYCLPPFVPYPGSAVTVPFAVVDIVALLLLGPRPTSR